MKQENTFACLLLQNKWMRGYFILFYVSKRKCLKKHKQKRWNMLMFISSGEKVGHVHYKVSIIRPFFYHILNIPALNKHTKNANWYFSGSCSWRGFDKWALTWIKGKTVTVDVCWTGKMPWFFHQRCLESVNYITWLKETRYPAQHQVIITG